MPQHCTTKRDLRASRTLLTQIRAQAMRRAANAVRYKAACAQGLRSADHGSTSSRPRSMKDVATTSMGEGVMRSVILRYLRRRSTPTGPSRMAPERQAACGMAWMVHNERRRLVARNHTTDVRFLEGPQMKCFLGGQKGWTHKVPWRTSPWPRWPVSRRPTMSESRKVIW